MSRAVALAVFWAAAAAADTTPINPVPNPINPAVGITTLVNTTTNGKLYELSSMDGVSMKILHTSGTAEEMGRAQGELLGAWGAEFLDNRIPVFLEGLIRQIKLPAWLEKIVDGKVGVDAAEAVLGAIYDVEAAEINKARSDVDDEMAGIAQGLCDSGAVPDCSVNNLRRRLQHLNMFPELVKMTCSMMGAWGSATADGKLIQLRTLDFGTGPWANYSVVHVHHPNEGNPFVTLSFPGFVGAITGFSSRVAISEKVWEVYTNPNVQPGEYTGMPDTVVLREILQFADNRGDAISLADDTKRNWAIFVGVGDFEDQKFDALGYRKQDVQVFGPSNISLVTHMPIVDDAVYIDKHPQPSHDQTTMPGLLQQYHGKLTADITASYIPRLMQSGDVHAAVYDFGGRRALFSTGKVDAAGDYLNSTGTQEGMAYNQPFIDFSIDGLLALNTTSKLV